MPLLHAGEDSLDHRGDLMPVVIRVLFGIVSSSTWYDRSIIAICAIVKIRVFQLVVQRDAVGRLCRHLRRNQRVRRLPNGNTAHPAEPGKAKDRVCGEGAAVGVSDETAGKSCVA